MLGLLVFCSGMFACLPEDSFCDRAISYVVSDGFTHEVSRTRNTNVDPKIDSLFEDKVRKLSLKVQFGQIRSRSRKLAVVSSVRSGSSVAPVERSFSAVQLGEWCFATEAPRSYSLRVVLDRFTLDILINIGAEVSETELAGTQVIAKELCERMARKIAADATAIDLDDDGNVNTTGHMTGAETPKSGYFVLLAWASARGSDVSFDRGGTSANLSYQGKSVRLVLASSKVTVNGVERDLGGKFILARGDRWFIPKAELEEAIDNG